MPHDKLMEEAFALAARIAANPYLSVRHAKRLVKMYWNWNRTDEGYREELESVLEITPHQGLPGRHAGVQGKAPAELHVPLRRRLAVSRQGRRQEGVRSRQR